MSAQIISRSAKTSAEPQSVKPDHAGYATNTSYRRNAGVGAMFLSFFGTLWIIFGAHAAGAGLPLLIITAVAGLTLFGFAWRRSRESGPQLSQDSAAPDFLTDLEANNKKVFRRVNAAQYLAITALIVALNVIGKPEWSVDGIILIVGAHFFPLARLFKSPTHYVIGAALILIAILVPVLSTPASPVAPVATGLVLWASALYGQLRKPF